MKVFVTGATGFVGSHLVEQLQDQGHEVFSLVRTQKKAQEFNTPGTLIQGSLSSEGENSWINELPSDLDAVIHTAGIVHSLDTDVFYKINTEATKQLALDLMIRFEKLRFIFISSLAAAGPSDQRDHLKEKDEASPVSDYGRSKLKAEIWLKENLKNRFELATIRPPMVIGPRDPAVLDVFKMVKSKVVLVPGISGNEKRYSFVCVFDLVETILKTLTKNELSFADTYYSSYPTVITMGELTQKIQDALGIKRLLYIKAPNPLIKFIATLIGLFKIDARLTPDKVNEILPMSWTCNQEKSVKNLEQVYQYDLEKTVHETLKDYRQRDWL
ncbi:NAD-dependent epimerase/dehydratase family protein [Halobacteriovorax sp. GB3]|uniref:NAD-dependent epimerase/dehydratase family protein n=1 Tax=Halobacteriovorax sp. GB3 TaxID=2719615 RepID=UPI0023612A41|nr:NAD-dependent epimerase/dehydratase family protein [Halobacteriovorax sp. GB3]MDD0852246.1 NAD-dependent epimerase/dehydratase family protein [Halobacteriovorax sp. GB3]